MAGRLAGQQLERGVVVDVDPAGRFRQHAAVAMIGVLAKTDVGDDQHVGGSFGRLDRALDDSLLAVRIAAQRILAIGNAEQDHSAQAQVGGCLDLFGRLIGRELAMAGQVPRSAGARFAPSGRTAAAPDWPDCSVVSCTKRRMAGE